MESFHGKKALIVDDEAGTRVILRAALEQLGMDIVEAVDGADAIHKSLETTFDITTMDILMPNVDGLDAIRAMRTVDPDCRIVVVSSCTEERYREAVRALHIEQFVAKPVRIDSVLAAVAAEMSRPSLTPAERSASLGMTSLADLG